MHRVLDALYFMAMVILSPWLLWRAWRTGRYRQRLCDKLLGLKESDIAPGAVWFHGVSLGEIHVLRTLVPAFRRRYPGRPCVVSATTDAGLAEAQKLFPELKVFAFPFDFSWACRRTMERIAPSLIVLTESELWPNFLREARKRHVPVALINGRMSPRSLGRYATLGPVVRHLFAGLDLVAVQTDEYAAAMLALGAVPGRVVVTGNIKYDGAATDSASAKCVALRELFAVGSSDLVWVAGSTCEPEEEMVVGIYRKAVESHPGLRLLLVPRQPDRFDGVAGMLEKRGVSYVRRSSLTAPLVWAEGTPAPVVLVDTLGELNAVWSMATVAFVGGSLDGKRGGQNMIEPAAYGSAVVFGPHVWNFRSTAERLVGAGGAYQVRHQAELSEVVLRLLGDAQERRDIGRLARSFVQSQQGATERTLDCLGQLLKPVGEEQAA